MSENRSLQEVNTKLRRENSDLRRRIAELEAALGAKSNPDAKEPAEPEKSKFDPYYFSDPVIAALSAIPRSQKRPSWLDI